MFALNGLWRAVFRNRLAVRLQAYIEQLHTSRLSAGQRRQRWAQLSAGRHLSIPVLTGADLGVVYPWRGEQPVVEGQRL